MHLSLIVAIAEDGAMGTHNQLPWHLPADLKFFKQTTLGKPVIMGRKTWDSLGKALPGRLNIVLSSGLLPLPEGVVLCHTLPAAIDRATATDAEEVFVIGGSKIFAEVMPQLNRMYITRVATTVPDADTFFPAVDYDLWQLAWEEAHPADEKNKFAYTFQRWERGVN